MSDQHEQFGSLFVSSKQANDDPGSKWRIGTWTIMEDRKLDGILLHSFEGSIPLGEPAPTYTQSWINYGFFFFYKKIKYFDSSVHSFQNFFAPI